MIFCYNQLCMDQYFFRPTFMAALTTQAVANARLADWSQREKLSEIKLPLAA